VILQAVIGEDGSVDHLEVLRSSHKAFERSALEAVRQRHEPATKGGKPVAVYLTVVVNYELRPPTWSDAAGSMASESDGGKNETDEKGKRMARRTMPVDAKAQWKIEPGAATMSDEEKAFDVDPGNGTEGGLILVEELEQVEMPMHRP